jgi:hypothetical protein
MQKRYLRLMKKVSNLGIVSVLNLIKYIYKNLIANITCNGEKTETFLRRSGTTQKCLLSSLFFNLSLEVLANATRQEKEIKGIQIWKEEIKLSLFMDDMVIYKENLKE